MGKPVSGRQGFWRVSEAHSLDRPARETRRARATGARAGSVRRSSGPPPPGRRPRHQCTAPAKARQSDRAGCWRGPDRRRRRGRCGHRSGCRRSKPGRRGRRQAETAVALGGGDGVRGDVAAVTGRSGRAAKARPNAGAGAEIETFLGRASFRISRRDRRARAGRGVTEPKAEEASISTSARARPPGDCVRRRRERPAAIGGSASRPMAAQSALPSGRWWRGRGWRARPRGRR